MIKARNPTFRPCRTEWLAPFIMSRNQRVIGLGGNRQRRFLPPKAAEVLHIDESWILLGSAVVSLAVPPLLHQLTKSRVDTIAPAEASTVLTADGAKSTLLLDVRRNDVVRREGVPFQGETLRKDLVVHAPMYMIDEDGREKRNPHFEDDVLFASGVNSQTAFLILDSEGGQGAQAAAEALSRLSTDHEISIIQGGFRAWRSAGLPMRKLKKGSTKEMHYLHLTLDNDDDGNSSSDDEVAAASKDSSGAARAEVLLRGGAPQAHAAPIFRPKLLDVLTGGEYAVSDLRQDILSGVTVGVIALSLSMALGIASESTPAIGLYTAVVSGFLISVFGGSKVVVGGPTAAFIPIVVGIAHEYGVGDLVVCTFIAGLMLIAMGVSGLGSSVKYVPRPVVTGFTAGIATYIFSTQIKDFLGLGIPGRLPEGVPVPSEFIEKVLYLGQNLGETHVPSLGLAVGCLALIMLYPPAWAKIVPPQITAVVAGTVALLIIDGPILDLHTGIETIGSHFGVNAIPRNFPLPHMVEGISPNLLDPLNHPEAISRLLKPSFTIALLAAIESLLCARVADGFIGDRHNPNTELIAQGIGNIASAAFGGLPATGALARTAANVRAGGRSPISGMVAATTVLGIILVAAPLAQYIPLPALSAVLVIVAINMGEWKNFLLLPGWPEKDTQLFLVAFTLTLMQDVSVAIEVGMFAALILFVKDVTTSTFVRAVPAGRSILDPNYTGLEGRLTFADASPRIASASALPAPTSAAARQQASRALLASLSGAHFGSSPLQSLDQSSSSEESEPVPPVVLMASEDGRSIVPSHLVVPPHTAYVEVSGSLLFGALDLFEEALEAVSAPDHHHHHYGNGHNQKAHQQQQAAAVPAALVGGNGKPAGALSSNSSSSSSSSSSSDLRCVILDLSHVGVVDASGLEVLEEQLGRLRAAGRSVVLCGLSRQPLRMLSMAGYLDQVGRANVCRSLEGAVARAGRLVADAGAGWATPATPVSGGGGGGGSGSSSSNGHAVGGVQKPAAGSSATSGAAVKV